jgi:tetratricopeptide (TPR) repeat protein
VLRSALRLVVLSAIAGCTAPAGPVRDAAEPLRAETPAPDPAGPELLIDALEREGDQHAAIGHRDLAAPLYQRAIELRAATDTRGSAARSLAELAVIEHDRGHLAEADHFYRSALAAEVEEGGGDPELRTLTLANLAWVLGDLAVANIAAQRRVEAIDFYQQALEIWEILQPASDELVAETLANLALLERARGEYDRARSLLTRALALYEKSLGADDPTLVRVRALLAANPPREPEPDPDPAEVARDLDREGVAHLDRREYVHARALLERAVSIHERGVTARAELGASLSYLGRTYAALGDRENARYVLQRSLEILEPALGKFDPLTLATRASLENLRVSAPADLPDH